MCAINGFTFNDPSLLKQMMNYCKNRGPDWEDDYYDDSVSIGHNRLSILDTDNRSNQPFIYKNLVLSFNGEIYNYLNLKNELEDKGYKFVTTSDTEVLIKLFYEYNIEAFKKLSGIFSISIWDKTDKTLYLIRDIVGVKPLYYTKTQHDAFAFASEIKQFTVLPDWQARGNLSRARDFLLNGDSDHCNQTFFSSVKQLKPGHYFVIDISGPSQELKEVSWYLLADEVGKADSRSFLHDCEEFKF